MEILDFLVP